MCDCPNTISRTASQDQDTYQQPESEVFAIRYPYGNAGKRIWMEFRGDHHKDR
jgi:hypothetical protein